MGVLIDNYVKMIIILIIHKTLQSIEDYLDDDQLVTHMIAINLILQQKIQISDYHVPFVSIDIFGSC